MDSSILLKNKQSKILIALRDTSQSWYVSSLARITATTYVHACNFVNTCEKLGIVQSEKHGKLKVIKLTDKGLKIAEMLSGINSLISQVQQQIPPRPAAQQPPQPATEIVVPTLVKDKETK